jgi:pyruvate formate lyase activating enzyme
VEGKARAVVNREDCTRCGDCAAVCDPKALEMIGRDETVESVMEVVLRDREYYAASGGGVTLSGGEPLYQPEFSAAVLEAAKREKIHTVVETSGFAEWATLQKMIGLVDLFLFDYKETDPHLHRSFTGQAQEPILENLRALHAAGARILLRCPMIPEYNARREHLDGIIRVARQLPKLVGVELLPYHRLGKGKLSRLGYPARMPESVAQPDAKTVDGWKSYLRKAGITNL